MTHSFHMPTRVVSGPGTLANIGDWLTSYLSRIP